MLNQEQQSWPLKEFFNHYTKLIEAGKPFTFVRWGDGEIAVLDGLPMHKDGLINTNKEWSFDNGGKTKLGEAMKDSLSLQGPDHHYGTPCRCCATLSEHMRLLPSLEESPVVPNTIFGNANYSRFIEWIKTLDDKGITVSLLINYLGEQNLDKFPFKVNKFYGAPSNCIQIFDTDGDRLLVEVSEFAKTMNNNVVFVSAGPMSEPFIKAMWLANPNNIYFDVGSSLDVYTKAGILNGSRPHHDPNNHYAKVECRMTGPFARPY